MIKKKGRRKRKVWTVIFIIIGVIVAAGLIGVLVDGPGRHEIAELEYSDIDFKNLKDGTYEGEYKGKKSHMRDTKVEVTVSEGEVLDVKIIKGAVDKEGKPSTIKEGKSIEDLFNSAVLAETLDVDVISGATITCKAHLKAFENALKKSENK